MEVPVEIDFQGMPASEKISARVREWVGKLEHKYPRITACRVAIKGPGQHHRSGALYEVNIRVALPDGREVNVERTAQADERHADLDFAVNDAFRRAQRQLQDHVRQLQDK